MAQRIVVGIDDSPGGRSAVTWALREAELRHATVEAIHTWVIPWAEGYNTEWANDRETIENELRGSLGAVIEAAKVDAASTVEPTLTVLAGVSPASALIEASAGADLLVVGSRGRGGFTSLTLGSVGTACVHHGHCPVVVVRPSEA